LLARGRLLPEEINGHRWISLVEINRYRQIYEATDLDHAFSPFPSAAAAARFQRYVIFGPWGETGDYPQYEVELLSKIGCAWLDARKVLDEARTLTGINPARATAYYALAAMPARYVVERGAWNEAAKLAASPSNFPFTTAMTHFARALGAARSGDPTAAQKDVERIAALRDELKTANNEYWANEVEVMRLASLSWVALAQTRADEALGVMRQAADMEDKSEKNIVTPGRLLPARELLGDMLMELKRPAEALKEYEASQLREPNRFRGLWGAGQAAAQSGNRDKARHYFSKLIEFAGSGDLRPEMEKVRRYLASN
jgi:tetratricopeptide (TPR) repeat protein